MVIEVIAFVSPADSVELVLLILGLAIPSASGLPMFVTTPPVVPLRMLPVSTGAAGSVTSYSGARMLTIVNSM